MKNKALLLSVVCLWVGCVLVGCNTPTNNWWTNQPQNKPWNEAQTLELTKDMMNNPELKIEWDFNSTSTKDEQTKWGENYDKLTQEKMNSMPNAASKYCEEQGGKISIEKDKEWFDMGMCTTKDWRKVEEWEYYKENNQTEEYQPSEEEQKRIMEDTAKAKEYVGLTKKEAEDKAKKENRVLRVTSEDWKANPVTTDLNLTRINVDLQNGKVIDAFIG